MTLRDTLVWAQSKSLLAVTILVETVEQTRIRNKGDTSNRGSLYRLGAEESNEN